MLKLIIIIAKNMIKDEYLLKLGNCDNGYDRNWMKLDETNWNQKKSNFFFDVMVITISISFNGKQSTINKSLDGSMYPA